MNYDEWLQLINKLDTTSLDINLIKEIDEKPINTNINNLLIPKLENIIKNRFEKSVSNIIDDLSNIFSDEYYLDMMLVNFKKEIDYIFKIINLKQIPAGNKNDLKDAIKIGTEKTYKILEEEALLIDETGNLNLIINNNKIKWS